MRNCDRLAGKVVWITGSTRGLGRRIALACAEQGAAVVVSGRDPATGASVVDSIEELGGRAVFAPCDVTDEAQVESAVASAVDTFGTLTGVVANASGFASRREATPSGKWVTELSLEAWEETLRSDLTGTFLTLKHGIAAMCAGSGGSVVTIASHSAMEGVNGNDAYTAAKGGVVALTRSVASYYARYDVRCNSLAVGFVHSGESTAATVENEAISQILYEHSLGRFGTPDDVAAATVFLLSDESAFVNAAVIPVDGGSLGVAHMPLRDDDLPRFQRRRPRSAPRATLDNA